MLWWPDYRFVPICSGTSFDPLRKSVQPSQAIDGNAGFATEIRRQLARGTGKADNRLFQNTHRFGDAEHDDADAHGRERRRGADRQAFVCKLVENVEHATPASIMGPVLDKVVGQNMVAVLQP
jgi:hypothetical protein